MTLAPWRPAVAHALHRNRSLVYSRYVQLATVDEYGRPANRTVVFRGFRANTNQLLFVTDRRSQKAHQAVIQPWAEICWYFPKTREQFRLLGQIRLIAVDTPDPADHQLRQQLWQQLSDPARLQFTWPQPGAAAAGREAFTGDPPPNDEPVAPFCVLLLEPERVDHLELRGEPQNRWLYERRGDTWGSQQINP
ncbi:MAG: pyridoxamine 5'-phosphate oxidase family protein [Gloeomargaritaceae cyanobacterium C42_A2020_066]|nr:pyridoxamine 5'-phosphate oxidase family protein [Gloeomargaritaceae cyanobacterium C42_A2020_066]